MRLLRYSIDGTADCDSALQPTATTLSTDAAAANRLILIAANYLVYAATARISFHQWSGNRRAELPTRFEVAFARLARHHKVSSGFHPTQAGGDGGDAPLGSLSALVAM
jgi:hypothetical protein